MVASLEMQRQTDPGACCPASLDYLARLRLLKDHCGWERGKSGRRRRTERKRKQILRHNTRRRFLIFIDICTNIPEYQHKQKLCTHNNKYAWVHTCTHAHTHTYTLTHIHRKEGKIIGKEI